MTNYQIGVRCERLWMAQMSRKGYTVERSAGSHGPVDCFAWNKDEVIFAQIKNGRNAYHNKDIVKLHEMERPKWVKVYLVVRVGGKVEWDWIEC